MAAIGTRLLTITIDSVDYTAQVSNVRITSAESDSDFVTFADAASGGARDYKLAMTMVQDAATGALWREVWDNAGDTVPFVVSPYGGTAGVDTPTFSGSAVITEPDGDILGGDADKSTSARMTIDVEWPITAKPTITTA